jgi:hypothetical protein
MSASQESSLSLRDQHLAGKNEGYNQVAETLRHLADILQREHVSFVHIENFREAARVLQQRGVHETPAETATNIARAFRSVEPASPAAKETARLDERLFAHSLRHG